MNSLDFIEFFVLFMYAIIDESKSLPFHNASTSGSILGPDADKNYVIFPGENGEDIYGYFETKKKIAIWSRESRPKGFNIFGYNYETDVKFTLYNRAHPNGSIIDRHSKNLTDHFDRSKKTKFVTHGWLSSGQSETCMKIKDNYVNRTGDNVIVMDWSAISGNVFYPIPMEATVGVSDYLAEFLNHFVANMSVNPSDMHLIGHSLGAHISGFAGRQVKGKIGRITGLDPAMPGFNLGLVSGGHLNKSDAEFVDVIHTCAGYLGYKEPLGHVDFYPNGGTFPQPGCNIVKFYEACSHGMSWRIFAKSIILRRAFIGTECSSMDQLNEKTCKGKHLPAGDATPEYAEGIYFVSTADYVQLLK